MRLTQLDMNLFVAFDAIYEERSLTRAAEILHITQPAASNALNRLRKQFDDPLFVRTPQGMMPTPLARNAAGPIRKALQLLDASVTPIENFEPGASQMTVSCSMIDLAEARILPSLLASFAEKAPGMSVRSYHVPRSEMATELASGRLAFAVDVPLPVSADLCHLELSHENYVCAVRYDHPVLKRKPTMKQYLGMGHLHVSSRRSGMGTMDLALKNIGKRRNIVARVTHYSAAGPIIENTDLALTLPRNMAHDLNLKSYALPFDVPSIALRLYWHKSVDNDPAHRWLREIVIENAGMANL